MTVAFASVGAVLIGWQFGATAFEPTMPPIAAAPVTTPGAPPSTASAQPGTTPKSTNRTITGSSVDTPYGSVQVAITVSGKSISEVSAVHLTDQGGRSVQISNYAAPILRGEVLQSQTAKVSMVSGATYTSEAYLSSLQSALDQLGG